MPDPIDTETPDSAKTRTGYDGQQYELVFSDEFNTPGRTFYPGEFEFLWFGLRGVLLLSFLSLILLAIPYGN